MDPNKRKKLEEAGYVVASVKEFLNLSDEEMAYIEVKVALAKALRRDREERSLTQLQAAKLLGSSQSRIAKMEAADASVSLDLLIRGFFGLGGTRQRLAEVVSGAL